MLNFSLSEKQMKLQKKVREFARKEILPVAWFYDELDKPPLSILRKSFDAGIMNADIPTKYGGKGYGLVEGAIAVEEIAAACSGLATSIFDNSLGMAPIMISNKEHIKEKYLREIAANFKLMCFATSEPTMGSDVASMRCKATKDGDGYILNGTKYWVTNGGYADYMTIFATVDAQSKHKGICAFVVEKDWEGVRIGKHIPKMGQRTSNTAGINFKNTRVPKENILAEPGEGFVLAMKTFDRTRPIIGSFGVGAARSALEFALDYAKRRHTFGSPISANQSIQFKLAEMYMKVEIARLLTWKAAWEIDQTIKTNISASIAKLYASEAALQVVSDALQIFAGYGYTRMYPIEKLLRDVRLLSIYEGTSEIQHLILSGHITGSYQPIMPALDDLPIFRWDDQDKDFQEAMDSQTAWRCPMCGYIHVGDEAPDECPYCFVAGKNFKKVWPA
ncbi:MAG: acyl-CoA dehydrogenase family protein [Deltaproteobacteria bacterium]|nr:acyl-CoA dehydrogenase family protein [Deltaproteobacteria bacterium]